jgi:hypothetical protein
MPDTIHLDIELEPDREPIAGVLRSPDLPARAFDGWLELASAIEDARHGAAHPLRTTPPGGDPASPKPL